MTYYFTSPYSTSYGNQRASQFGVTGTPTVWFDGTIPSVGGIGVGSMLPYYEPDVAARQAASSPLSIDASYVILDDEVTVTCGIDLGSSLGGSHSVQFLVCQDGLHGQSNMVVQALSAEPFTLSAPGQNTTVSRTFPMNAAWNEDDLRIVVFVQEDASRNVLQAAMAVPDYAATLVLDCVPDGVAAQWQVSGPSLARSGAGDRTLNVFAAGTFTVTWEDIPYWTTPTPNPQVVTVGEDGTVTFTGQYSDGPFAALASGPLGDAGSARAAGMVDVDGDGNLDLHIVNDGSGDQLLLGDGAGGFTPAPAMSGPLADTGAGRGAAWADYDGDGHLDLFLARENQSDLLLKGDGAGDFATAAQFGADDAGPAVGASWVDYDLDGDLDLYVVRTGADNLLLQNAVISGGMIIFSAQASAIDGAGQSRTATWLDLDYDGRSDVYLVNGFQNNALYNNLDVGFIDESSSSNIADGGNGTAAAWGDYDNDGDLDLYLANDGQADRLYRCTGPLQYALVNGAEVSDNGHARAATWADFDNDTFLDLYVARDGEPDMLLLGDGTGAFTRVPAGLDQTVAAAGGIACGDVDNDGRLDVFLARAGASNALLANGIAAGHHWLQVKLTGSGTNTAAIGARVTVTAGGVTQTRVVMSGSASVSQDAFTCHFGLGASTGVDGIEIFWPSGLHQVIGAVGGDALLEVTEGVSPAAVPDEQPRALRTSLGAARPNPFNPATSIEFALEKAGRVRVDLYDVNGRHVRSLVDAALGAGRHAVVWHGRDDAGRAVASGTYLVRMRAADGTTDTGRITLVK